MTRVYSKHQGLLLEELDPLFSSWKALMKYFQLLLWDFVPGAADKALAGWFHLAKDALPSDFCLMLLRLLLPDTAPCTHKCFLPCKAWQRMYFAEEQETQIKMTVCPQTFLLFFMWLVAVY